MNSVFFGAKKNMAEAYIGENRVAVTRIEVYPMKVAALKDAGKAQVVFGKGKKNPTKALSGHLKKSGVKSGTIREIAVVDGTEVGQSISFSEILVPGAVVTAQGTAKGKGFAGVVKRWGFAGGPRTHGQSDRHRAPGSVGQGTTPGRIHRGKKMAGRMGSETVSVKNMTVVAVSGNSIWVTGPVPGSTNTMIKLTVTDTKEAPSVSFLNGFNPVAAVAETPAEETNVNPVTETEAAAPAESAAPESDAKTEETTK